MLTSTPESVLRLRRLRIDTYQEPVIYMRRDCPVCRSEGFEAHSRVHVEHGDRWIIATLNVVDGGLLAPMEAGLSEYAWRLLGAEEGALVRLSHPAPLESLSVVRAKVYGRRLDATALRAIISDVVDGRYSAVELAAFVTACASNGLDEDETTALTLAMVDTGDRLCWERTPVADKHSVGGLPGNRTTPIVVAIVTACGLVMPKTSSRAITSPAGTADMMETLAPVDLDLAAMRRVVDREGGCIVWGGSVRLSPADDILIRVERVLDLDSEGQLVASVLSKKLAAGATHVVIDMPVGPTAKVRSDRAAAQLAGQLVRIGRDVGLSVFPVITDGSQPVGRGIGPALEARDVLAVLQGQRDAPGDLRDRASLLAGSVLEVCGAVAQGGGGSLARQVLDDGRAWRKFQAICEAQGGMREPPVAPYHSEIPAARSGIVSTIDNRRLARVAKLAGAPLDPPAGIELHVRLGTRVDAGQPLFTVHSASPGELAYALEFLRSQPAVIQIDDVVQAGPHA
jgi:thymidine phosphorylase